MPKRDRAASNRSSKDIIIVAVLAVEVAVEVVLPGGILLLLLGAKSECFVDVAVVGCGLGAMLG